MNTGPVTMEDVARRAEVSRASVSLAFNAPEKLLPTTREKILQAAQDLGYRRNQAARSLRTRRTDTIGLLLPQAIDVIMQNPYYAGLIEGIGQVCQLEGYALMLVPPLRGSMLKAIPTASVDGFIICGLKEEHGEVMGIIGEHVPAVIIDPIGPVQTCSVEIDEVSALAELVGHLLQLGHRRIGIAAIEDNLDVVYTTWQGTVGKRLKAVDDALRRVGLDLESPEISVVHVPCTYSGGVKAFTQLHAGAQPPTAIIAFSDVIALGILRAARDAGVNVPVDLSLSGFDDLPVAELAEPRLTTIRQPIVQKGRVSANLLVDQIKSSAGTANLQHHKLPTALVIRDSIAVPAHK